MILDSFKSKYAYALQSSALTEDSPFFNEWKSLVADVQIAIFRKYGTDNFTSSATNDILGGEKFSIINIIFNNYGESLRVGLFFVVKYEHDIIDNRVGIKIQLQCTDISNQQYGRTNVYTESYNPIYKKSDFSGVYQKINEISSLIPEKLDYIKKIKYKDRDSIFT